jgi:FixJ family two-component response regulator
MDEPEGGLVSVIDDDASLRRSLRNLLSSVGLRVETFESAEVFLQSRMRDTTRCIVLDLRMPGMGGLDLLRHLRAAGSSLPVIIVTAHGDAEMRRQTLEAGALAFLEKPVQGPALVGLVRQALSGV